MSEKLRKWAIELSEFEIEYRPRSAIKGQVLVDFIVERSEVHPQGFGDERWILETYRSSQVQGGGVAMVLRKLEGSTIAQAVKLTYTVSNNEVEYEAVLL